MNINQLVPYMLPRKFQEVSHKYCAVFYNATNNTLALVVQTQVNESCHDAQYSPDLALRVSSSGF